MFSVPGFLKQFHPEWVLDVVPIPVVVVCIRCSERVIPLLLPVAMVDYVGLFSSIDLASLHAR